MKKKLTLMLITCWCVLSLCGCNNPFVSRDAVYKSNMLETTKDRSAQDIVREKVVKYVNNIEIYKDTIEEDKAVMIETLDNFQQRLGSRELQYHVYEVDEGYIQLYVNIVDENNVRDIRYYSNTINIPIKERGEMEDAY